MYLTAWDRVCLLAKSSRNQPKKPFEIQSSTVAKGFLNCQETLLTMERPPVEGVNGG